MRTAVVTLVGAALLLLVASPSKAITLGFEPSSQSVTAGSAVNVGVVISGLGSGAAPSLSTFDLNVTFASSVVSFLSFTFGDPSLGDQLDLSSLGSITDVTTGAGVVNVFELSFDSAADLHALQAGSFTLGTLRFSAQSAGVSPLGIVINALGDATGDSLAADTLAGQVAVVGAVVVPAPAPLLLVLVGVVGVAGLRARGPLLTTLRWDPSRQCRIALSRSP